MPIKKIIHDKKNNKNKLNMQNIRYTRYILKGYFHIFASFKLTNLTDKLLHA